MTTTVNNGQSGSSATVCPTAGAQYTFSATSTSDAVLTWTRVITRGLTPASDVVSAPISTATLLAKGVLDATVSFATTTSIEFNQMLTATRARATIVTKTAISISLLPRHSHSLLILQLLPQELY